MGTPHLLKELKSEYGHTDDNKEWLLMRKAHLKKWKLIKQQAAKAAASGRGGEGGSGKKQAFLWKYVANIQGEGLTLGVDWTRCGKAAVWRLFAWLSQGTRVFD